MSESAAGVPSLTGASAVALPSRSLAQRLSWAVPDPRVALGLLLVAAVLCRIVWLTVPDKAIVFDETYYVNAARVILGLKVPANAPYAGDQRGLDPNREHPPLGKVLIAGSMRIFGDDPVGWRLPSLVTGIAAIFLLFAIVRRASGDDWLGVLAAGLFAFDNLVLVHGRIGTLDMPLVAFLLLGAWLVMRDRPLLGGMAVALATLVKIGGVYGLAALILFELGLAFWDWQRSHRLPRGRLTAVGLLVAGYVPVLLGGLWLLDHWFSVYRTPWDHLHYILQYGFNLTQRGGPVNIESYPWQWLVNEVQIHYFTVNQNILVNHQVVATRTIIDFRGAMNPMIIGSAPLGLSFLVWRVWKYRDVLALWAVAWVVATYLPFYPLAMLENRVSYIYYFLPTIPAITVGLAQLLRQGNLPRVVVWGFLLGVLLGFVGYFPFRTII